MPELDIIGETGDWILRQNPDPVVRYRLLRDVLRKPADDPKRIEAAEHLEQSRWIQALAREQWPDGSWGRFHTKDAKARQRIGTTEMGVARARALGLEVGHLVLSRATRYLMAVLDGTVQIRDRVEKNDRWPTGVQLFAAATLAQIDPESAAINETWGLWLNIASRTFADGVYDPEAEVRAHRELSGASIRNSYLIIDNKYALTLLSARAGALPGDVEALLVNWIWHKENGIGYLGEKPATSPDRLKPGRFERWFLSQELLSRFNSWRDVAQDVVSWLWHQRSREGIWDFGQRPSFSLALPLSESWRQNQARQIDWTTLVLGLLRRYYDEATEKPSPDNGVG